MMAKPMKTLKLHYPTIQSLINTNSPFDSIRAGSTLSHVRERRRAKRSGGREPGEEVLDFTLATTLRMLVLQSESAHRLEI